MHELSICQSLMGQVETIALERNARCVLSIVVAVGPLSGVEAQLLINAFPVASAGSIAEQAKLLVETLPVRVKCSQCGKQSDTLPNKLLCANCGDWRTTLISGDELMLMSVELEQIDTNQDVAI